jgi:hypothetical protein
MIMKDRKIPVIVLCLVVLSTLAVFAAAGAQEPPARAIRLKVTAEQANLREKPDIGSAVVQQIPEGTVLEADKKEGEWYLVRYRLEDGGVIAGYIHESLVTVVDESGTPVATPVREKKPEAEPRQAPRDNRSESWYEVFLPVDITFSLGGGTVGADDFNKGARGLADTNGAFLDTPGSGSVGTLRLTYVLGVDLAYRVTRHLAVGLGVDFQKGWRESRVTYGSALQVGGTPETTTRPVVQDVPVKLNLRFYPRPDFYIRASLVYNLVRAGYDYLFAAGGTTWQQWSGRATGHTLGMEIGAGGEWAFSSKLLFFAEADFRLAPAIGLSGTGTFRDSSGASLSESGPLWFYEQRGADGLGHDLLFIRAAQPTGSDILGARRASVNMTGTAVKAGVKLRF